MQKSRASELYVRLSVEDNTHLPFFAKVFIKQSAADKHEDRSYDERSSLSLVSDWSGRAITVES